MLKGATNDKTLQTLQTVGKLIYSTTIKRASVAAGKKKRMVLIKKLRYSVLEGIKAVQRLHAKPFYEVDEHSFFKLPFVFLATCWHLSKQWKKEPALRTEV